MKDIEQAINKLVKLVLYEENLMIDGEEITDEVRLYIAESLEFTKKMQYLMQGKNYVLPKYIVEQRDVAYRLRQLMYFCEEKAGILKIGEYQLTSEAHMYLYNELQMVFKKVAQDV